MFSAMHTTRMLVVFIRTVIIYLALLLGIRLMGKRTISELQPFEFVITMAIADLACMPMQDIAVPLVYGLVPLFVMFLLHFAFTWLATKSVKFRKFLNGKPIIVVTPEGIDSESMAKLNFTINDLLESIRSQQFFSVEQIKYAVLETNGNLSILENSSAPEPNGIPVTLVVEGRKMSTNFDYAGVDEGFVENYIAGKNLKLEDVVLMTLDENRVFLQPQKGKFIAENVEISPKTALNGGSLNGNNA